MYERSVVAAMLTNGLLDAVRPGSDSRTAAKKVVALYQAILSELARNNLPAGDGELGEIVPDLAAVRAAFSAPERAAA